jgi:NADH-quinone oxidoreductase subunit J
MEILIFIILATVAVSCSVMVISQRSAVYSALFLIATMVTLALLFLMLNSPFLAAVQVIVYAGAIMVLFIFVIMLLNLRKDEFGPEKRRAQRFFGIFFVFLLLVGIATVIEWGMSGSEPAEAVSASTPPAGVEPLAQLLFTKYLLPFELASILLLVAIVGAIIMAKRKL